MEKIDKGISLGDLPKDLKEEAVECFIIKALKKQRGKILKLVLRDVPTKYQDRLVEFLK